MCLQTFAQLYRLGITVYCCIIIYWFNEERKCCAWMASSAKYSTLLGSTNCVDCILEAESFTLTYRIDFCFAIMWQNLRLSQKFFGFFYMIPILAPVRCSRSQLNERWKRKDYCPAKWKMTHHQILQGSPGRKITLIFILLSHERGHVAEPLQLIWLMHCCAEPPCSLTTAPHVLPFPSACSTL